MRNPFILFNHRRRRSRSRPRSQRGSYPDDSMEPTDARTILMTNTEAVHSLYGEISTERDGDLTHQCIQTNLADVICGGKDHWLSFANSYSVFGNFHFECSWLWSNCRKSQWQSHLCSYIETKKCIISHTAKPRPSAQLTIIWFIETITAMCVNEKSIEKLCSNASNMWHGQQQFRISKHWFIVAEWVEFCTAFLCGVMP